MRVLIVEDEKRLAEALGQLMKEQRYAVDLVYDGEDGLAYGRSGQYDVIVLDVMLPRMDGFEVVRRLRQKKIATPVLLLTARDEVPDKVAGLDCGADDYMTKPFSPEAPRAGARPFPAAGDVVLEEMRFADLVLNLSTYTLHCAARSVHLGFKGIRGAPPPDGESRRLGTEGRPPDPGMGI